MEKKLNVLVCGSNFGKVYIDAIKKCSDDFNLVGILCKGSRRSEIISVEYGVPLYKSAEQLPENIDLACVIVRSDGIGGNGTELSIELMKKNISVVQEQPVHNKYQVECYKVARANNVVYLTADLYLQLENIKVFVERSRELLARSKLQFIHIACSTQIAYTALDILAAAGVSSSVKLASGVTKMQHAPFDIICATIGNIPTVIEYNNRIDPTDPDHNMYVMHRFDLYFEDGLLSLVDTYGAVIWRPRAYIGMEKLMNEFSDIKMFEILHEGYQIKMRDIYKGFWLKAIQGELYEIKKYIEHRKMNQFRVARELCVSKNWEQLNKIAGYADFIE